MDSETLEINTNPQGEEKLLFDSTYNFPGVMLFLQKEWQQFEAQKIEWELERVELKVEFLRLSHL